MANRLLEALPLVDRQRVVAGCEQVRLAFADVLCERGQRTRYAYFPTGGFISLLAPIAGRRSLAVGLVGDEGMLGLTLILGIDVSPLQGLVQGSGLAWRIAAKPFRRELARNLPLQSVLNRYLYVSMSQLALAATCTGFHVVEARLARWLLMTADRAHSDEFHLTHEFLGHMLGVRRVGVTRAASALRQRGLIRYRRGHITLLDRGGLEQISCKCYLAPGEVYRRLPK